MNGERPLIRLWLIGLGVFVLVIAMGVWLRAVSEFGIVDHQIAGTADQVNLIQQTWREEGARPLAIAAMLGDLVFIGIYGWGSWIAGRSFMQMRGRIVRVIGSLVAAAAAVFLLTDYGETGLQFVQLVRDEGSDAMARTAASLQPTKVAAWIVTFTGVIAGLLARRFLPRDA